MSFNVCFCFFTNVISQIILLKLKLTPKPMPPMLKNEWWDIGVGFSRQAIFIIPLVKPINPKCYKNHIVSVFCINFLFYIDTH